MLRAQSLQLVLQNTLENDGAFFREAEVVLLGGQVVPACHGVLVLGTEDALAAAHDVLVEIVSRLMTRPATKAAMKPFPPMASARA